MRKRTVTEYQEPHCLDDLVRIVSEHEGSPGQTRVWVRIDHTEDGEVFTVCLSTPPLSEA